MKVYNSFSDSWVDSNIMLLADKLLKLKSEKSMWEVIDEVISWWIKTRPTQWKAHLIEIKDLKETRTNKWASTKDKSLRYVLDIPEKIMLIIRKLYNTQECPMDKRWMLKFARRYPSMVVAEKV